MMLIRTLIIAVSFFVIGIYASCDDNRDVLIGEKCFQFNDVYVNYTYAMSVCHSQGYSLGSIHSESESTEIGEVARQRFHSFPYWIGLKNGSNGFHWDDLTTVNYYNWAKGYPDGKPYVFVNATSYLWFTATDRSEIRFICSYYTSTTTSTPPTRETPKQSTIETTTTTTMLPRNNCQEGDIILNEKCYSFNNIKLNYSNARAECSLIGKTLAIFDNINQITFLSSYAQTKFATTYTSFWIGLQRDTSTTPFYWQDGADLKFANWSPGYPYSGQRFVGQDIANTKWRTFTEDQLLFSVCSGNV